MASFAAGPHARPGGLLPEVSRAARSAPPPPEGAPPCDLFLDGFAKLVTDGHAAAAASLRVAVDTFLGDEVSDSDFVQWGHLATSAARMLWDWYSWEALSAKHVEVARVSGALAPLSDRIERTGCVRRLVRRLRRGDCARRGVRRSQRGDGNRVVLRLRLLQAAYQGRPDALALMSASAADSVERGRGTVRSSPPGQRRSSATVSAVTLTRWPPRSVACEMGIPTRRHGRCPS